MVMCFRQYNPPLQGKHQQQQNNIAITAQGIIYMGSAKSSERQSASCVMMACRRRSSGLLHFIAQIARSPFGPLSDPVAIGLSCRRHQLRKLWRSSVDGILTKAKW